MFSNLNWWNVVVLLLLALFIFGDKLPQVISETLRTLRNLRRMAQNATTDLSRELGTDIRIEDLNPKTFVRKHLLSESEQEALTKPIKGLSDDLQRQARHLQDEFTQLGTDAQGTMAEATGPAAPPQAGPAPGGTPAEAAAEPTAETNAARRRLDEIT